MSETSRLGFGTWSHGGVAYGEVAEADASDAINCALTHGISFFDTADIYGDGRAEVILGRAIAHFPEAVIATKAGYLREGDPMQDFSSGYLGVALRNSLRRIARDSVDVFLLHSPPEHVLSEPTVPDIMNQFQKQGLIRAWGVSLRSHEHISAALRLPGCQFVEVIFNLLDQRPLDAGLFGEAERAGVKVIARVPLCFGLLGPKYAAGHKFSVPDQRARWSQAQIDAWITGAKKFHYLVNDQRSIIQAAISFCLSVSQIAFVIPGMKTSAQVLHNLRALEPSNTLTSAEIRTIRSVWANLRHIVPT